MIVVFGGFGFLGCLVYGVGLFVLLFLEFVLVWVAPSCFQLGGLVGLESAALVLIVLLRVPVIIVWFAGWFLVICCTVKFWGVIVVLYWCGC